LRWVLCQVYEMPQGKHNLLRVDSRGWQGSL